ncbi:retrovirus-related pol polyprotein from transposon TNT 1-94 [Tanacetum coccineum]
MYRIKKIETRIPNSKTNINICHSTGVESFNSVRRPKSKDTKSKDRALKNNNDKRPYAHVQKKSSSVSIDSNKRETMHSNVCQSNASVLSTKTVNVVNDGSNIVCISCGKDMFLLSHEKYIARYALSRNSSVKRALFTTLIAAKSKNLGATSVVAKSRLSVAKTPTSTNKVIQLILWIVDSGCSKHMTGNLQLLRNFVEKFMGTVRFGNDHFAAIPGFGDYVQGNLMICHVYYVEGLGHNLFSIGQFCDGDLKVAFRSNTCYVQNLEGDDLITGSRDSNLYTISISEMVASSPVCLMSRATSTKSWLWPRRLSHLNFGTINQLTSKDLVDGLLKFKYNKDHLCSACEQGKCKKASFLPKLVPSTVSKLELLHMDLCGPMRVVSINGKKYILVIVDDYSRHTWVYFLRTKDEAPDMIIDFINQVQRNLKAQILMIQTDNGSEFKNEKLRAFYVKLGIVHKTLIAQMPQQNGVVKRRTRTLVENRSIVHTRYNKNPYELIRGRKPNIQSFYMFGSLCYPINDCDDLGKMKLKTDIGIFIGYSESPRGFYSSEDSQSVPSKTELDNLFGPLYEEYYVTSSPEVSDNSTANTLDNENISLSSSIVVEKDEAPQIVSSSAKQVATEPNSPVLNENADEFVQEDVADFDGNMFYNAPPTHVFEEAESSSTYQDPSNMHEFHQKHRSSTKWTKNHLIEQVIGDPSKPIESMQDELNQFKRLDVWELVECPIVAKRYRQEEGINFEESFTLVARLEALQYTVGLLKKHGMEKCDTISTLMATTKLNADLQGTQVDQTKYRSMIGGLMYLTARRPDIAFATFVCARYQTQTMQGVMMIAKAHLEAFNFWGTIWRHSISWGQDHVEKGTIELYFVGTEYQLADLFTKSLPKERFEYLVYKIGMRCMTPTELERLAKLSS